MITRSSVYASRMLIELRRRRHAAAAQRSIAYIIIMSTES